MSDHLLYKTSSIGLPYALHVCQYYNFSYSYVEGKILVLIVPNAKHCLSFTFHLHGDHVVNIFSSCI